MLVGLLLIATLAGAAAAATALAFALPLWLALAAWPLAGMAALALAAVAMTRGDAAERPKAVAVRA